MNGIQAITVQIAADAQTEADRILAQARARAKECLSTYQEQAYIQSTALLEHSERESALWEERFSYAAILAARNLRLSTEQEMRERAFATALKQLSELSDGEYIGLLAGLAAEASSTGREEVILSQKGRARHGKQVVTQVNERLRDGHLTPSVQTRPIRGRLIPSDGDVEVNCTFETLMRLLRGEMDRMVVEVLFGWALRQGGESLSKIRDTNYLTTSAHMRTMEDHLVTRERMERMVEACSDGEVVKVPIECGHEELPALTNRKLDELLSAARAVLYWELGGAVPDKRLVELFQMKYDYHNAKALVKGAVVGTDADRLLMEGGRWSATQVKKAFQRGSLRESTGPFRRAVMQARKTLNGGNDLQLADFVLDRAHFAGMAGMARAAGSPFLEGYVWLLIDAANLRSAVRCARMGEGSDFLSQVLLLGGNVEVHVPTSGKGSDSVTVFRAGSLSDAAAAGAALTVPGSGELTAFERLYDDAVMGYLVQARRIPFGEQAVVGYLYAREAEFTAIRTILSGRIVGPNANTIWEGLCEAYV